MGSGRMDLPAREVAGSSVSSSSGALSISMSVTAEVGLERYMIHSVRTEVSVGLDKCKKDAHPEATGTSILILGKVFRVFGGATLGCLAIFSVGSGVDVRVRFCVWVLGATFFSHILAGSWCCLDRCLERGGESISSSSSDSSLSSLSVSKPADLG